MTQPLYIGIDGGATKSIIRVEDASGQLLGRETSGPASIRLSVDQAWESILTALNKILHAHALHLDHPSLHFHVGMGLAGCEIPEAYQLFLQHAHPFKTLLVTSDAHTACLGAHNGADGANCGHRCCRFSNRCGHETKTGGWGFIR